MFGATSITNWIIRKLIIIPGILIGLSVHEFGHAKVAQLCGDRTAESQGRVSLSPFAHIDIVGLISLFCFGFGWGKPVMVNPRNFKKPRLNSIFVGLAGVFMNFVCAAVFAVILRLIYQFAPDFLATGFGDTICNMIVQTVVINLSLMLFNLLPIPPLDGFGVVSDIINLPRLSFKLYVWLRRYGYGILIICIILDVPSRLLGTPLNTIYYWLFNLVFTGL